MKRFSILALALAMFTGAVAVGFAQTASTDSTKKTTKKKKKARKATKPADTKKPTN